MIYIERGNSSRLTFKEYEMKASKKSNTKKACSPFAGVFPLRFVDEVVSYPPGLTPEMVESLRKSKK